MQETLIDTISSPQMHLQPENVLCSDGVNGEIDPHFDRGANTSPNSVEDMCRPCTHQEQHVMGLPCKTTCQQSTVIPEGTTLQSTPQNHLSKCKSARSLVTEELLSPQPVMSTSSPSPLEEYQHTELGVAEEGQHKGRDEPALSAHTQNGPQAVISSTIAGKSPGRSRCCCCNFSFWGAAVCILALVTGAVVCKAWLLSLNSVWAEDPGAFQWWLLIYHVERHFYRLKDVIFN
jgi:hypothetical protein